MPTQLIRVVIVDDHQVIRQTWKMILNSSEGIEVIAECASGQEAIDTAARIHPDIILMDINMSPINGFEATRRIVAEYPTIKIIGVSINNQPSYVRNLLQCGAKGYVTKNSSRDEMIHAIQEVYNGNSYLCKDVLKEMGKDSF